MTARNSADTSAQDKSNQSDRPSQRERAAARPGTRSPSRWARGSAIAATWLVLGLHAASAGAAETILFIGNSFTFGQGSAVQTYNPGSVTDLNGTGIGGVPALFKAFTVQAGLDYTVSLETQPGIGLDWHYDNRLPLLDQPWDHVVMHGQSTLDFGNPGNPANVTQYSGLLGNVFMAQNPNVDINLMATWSRADQTYPSSGFWYGQPISAMAFAVQAGYEFAAAAHPGVIDRVIPVGLAWNTAMDLGIADNNPYDGVSAGQFNLWASDSYHASRYGSYLEALVVFGTITGLDPRSLGGFEQAAHDLGITPIEAFALQSVAFMQISAVPEAPTWMMLVMGGTVCLWMRRRRVLQR